MTSRVHGTEHTFAELRHALIQQQRQQHAQPETKCASKDIIQTERQQHEAALALLRLRLILQQQQRNAKTKLVESPSTGETHPNPAPEDRVGFTVAAHTSPQPTAHSPLAACADRAATQPQESPAAAEATQSGRTSSLLEAGPALLQLPSPLPPPTISWPLPPLLQRVQERNERNAAKVRRRVARRHRQRLLAATAAGRAAGESIGAVAARLLCVATETRASCFSDGCVGSGGLYGEGNGASVLDDVAPRVQPPVASASASASVFAAREGAKQRLTTSGVGGGGVAAGGEAMDKARATGADTMPVLSASVPCSTSSSAVLLPPPASVGTDVILNGSPVRRGGGSGGGSGVNPAVRIPRGVVVLTSPPCDSASLLSTSVTSPVAVVRGAAAPHTEESPSLPAATAVVVPAAHMSPARPARRPHSPVLVRLDHTNNLAFSVSDSRSGSRDARNSYDSHTPTSSRSSSSTSTGWTLSSSQRSEEEIWPTTLPPTGEVAAGRPPPPGVAGVAGNTPAVPRADVERRESSPPSLPLSFRRDASPTTFTQHTLMEEFEAIERGEAAPYTAYLFSPEVRMVDLNAAAVAGADATAMSGGDRARWDRAGDGGEVAARPSSSTPTANRNPPGEAQLAATCVSFDPSGTCYVIGTSTGLLWFVPVRSSHNVMHTTYLGGVHQSSRGGHASPGSPVMSHLAATGVAAPYAEGSPVLATSPLTATSSFFLPQSPLTPTAAAAATGGAVEGHTSGAAASPSAAGAALSLVPLHGHSDSVTSIGFSDDGSFFSTASLDRSVMLWKTSTRAKLRRIAATLPPLFARFVPFNNNHLLVCFRGERQLRLYNSSTGLVVTSGSSRYHHQKVTAAAAAAASTAPYPITALAIEPCATPFFFTGDVGGNVVMWTYRAEEDTLLPTLSEEEAVKKSGAARPHAAGSLAGPAMPSPLLGHSRQLPELRRVASLALTGNHPDPTDRSGDGGAPAALSVSAAFPVARVEVCSMNATQAMSVLRAQQRLPHSEQCRVSLDWALRQSSSSTPATHSDPSPSTFAQTPSLMEAASRGKSKAKGGERRKGGATTTAGRGVAHTATTTMAGSKDGGSVFSGIPGKVADTFSAYWAAATSAMMTSSSTASATAPGVSAGRIPPSTVSRPSSSASTPPASAAAAVPSTAAPAVSPKVLRHTALQSLSPLLLAVSLPCDTTVLVGVHQLTQQRHGDGGDGAADLASSSGGVTRSHGAGGASAMAVTSHALVALLEIRGQCRLRHVGAGTVFCRDNARLATMACPCEEGFVRVLTTSVTTGGPRRAGAAAGSAQLNVLATLPMPCGGLCRDLMWSPDARFLVAVTTEGMVFQWERVFLLPPLTASGTDPAQSRAEPPHTQQPRGAGNQSAVVPAQEADSVGSPLDLSLSPPRDDVPASTAVAGGNAGPTAPPSTSAFTVQRAQPRRGGVPPPPQPKPPHAVDDTRRQRQEHELLALEERKWRESLQRERQRQWDDHVRQRRFRAAARDARQPPPPPVRGGAAAAAAAMMMVDSSSAEFERGEGSTSRSGGYWSGSARDDNSSESVPSDMES